MTTPPDRKLQWDHFDGSIGDITISKRDYLEGTYTFGSTGKCKIVAEFSGLDISNRESAQWLQVTSPSNPFMALCISSGFGDFDPASGQATTAAQFYQTISAGARQLWAPLGYRSFSSFSNLDKELLTLTVILDRSTSHPAFTVDFKSTSFVICDYRNVTCAQSDDEALAKTFSFRFGARMQIFFPDGNQVGGTTGIDGVRVRRFFCEAIL